MRAGDIERVIGRYRLPDWLRRHSALVGELAQALASSLRGAGAAVDLELVRVGAALHDVGKSPLLEGDPRAHNELSALVLAAEGLGEVAEIARRHPVYAIRTPGLVPLTLEEKIVYYADRRAGLEIVPLEVRLRDQAARFPRWSAEILSCLEPAQSLERELFAHLEIRPEHLCAKP